MLPLAFYLGGQGRTNATETLGCGMMRYYIATRARLQGPELVYIFGATNLPPGSVLVVYLYDCNGREGSEPLNDEVRTVVKGDGLFEVEVHPKRILQERDSLACEVVFAPNDPAQPKNVVRVVGRTGRCLGNEANNPQVRNNSTGTGGMLIDVTVVGG